MSSNLLNKSKLNEIKEWLKSIGGKNEKTKCDYEVLRMRHPDHEILLIYDRNNAVEHYTTFGIGSRLVRQWIHKRDKNKRLSLRR